MQKGNTQIKAHESEETKMKKATLKKLVEAYGLSKKTTSEKLDVRWEHVMEYGDKVIMAGYFYNVGNCWFAASYRYTTEDHTCEGEIKPVAVSEERFEDAGHAIEWAMKH